MDPNRLAGLEAEIAALQQRIATLPPADLSQALATLQTLLAEQAAMHAALSGDGTLVQGSGHQVAVDDSTLINLDGNNHSVTVIRNVYRQAPGAPALDDAAFDAALGRYLHWVAQRYGRLNLRGVEKRERQVLSLTLDDVYVSLAAVVNLERRAGRSADVQPRDAQAEPIDMNRLLAIGPRLVITGGPGSGKTTYLHLIAASLARAIRLNATAAVQTYLGLDAPLPLPIVVTLSEYNRYRRQHAQSTNPRHGTLIAFISHSLIRQHAAIGLPDDFFERLLVNGRACLLLLDGLDEVANERERALVRQAVEELAYNTGVRQVVVSSRSRAYQGQAVLPETFRVAAVQPMTPAQVAALAARWCTAVYPTATEAAAETYRLQDAIANLEALRAARQEPRLADSPLLVTIVAIVHYNQRRLPDQRAELYERCVEVLLAETYNRRPSDATYELQDWGGNLAEKRGHLAYLAHQMMAAGAAAGRSADEWRLDAWLRPRFARQHGEAGAEARLAAFVQAMRERGSLLAERGGDYQFTHLTFQEFLCAYYLAEAVRDPDKMVALLAENGRFPDPWWRETILLTAGYLGSKNSDTALAFIAGLARLPGRDEAALAAAELAGTAFLELEGQDEGTKTAVVERLVTLLTARDITAAPLIRLLGGDALGRLGDPRPGVCTPEPEMLPVPTGPFLMGDKTTHTVTIETPFAIARHPVTNAQYRRFIEDGGYTDRWRRCWTADGWRYFEGISRRQPRYWDEPRFGNPNQPVVGVSWYEAAAYAGWLAATTGRPYRLPTEAEWERAARHTDGRTYPWRDSWQDGVANTKEAELNRPAAVGVFPGDTAVCGAQDMGGNVIEWCQTRWHDEKRNAYPQPYRADDGRENLAGDGNVARVLRGGSWGDSHRGLVRCGARVGVGPSGGGASYGFRLVLSPSDSGR